MPTKDLLSTGRAQHGIATVAGGSAAEAVTIAGLAVGDTLLLTNAATTNACYLLSVVITANTATVTWNTDPGASTLNYLVVHKDA